MFHFSNRRRAGEPSDESTFPFLRQNSDMPLFLLAAIALADPLTLDVRGGELVVAGPGLTDAATGRSASVADVAKAAKDVQFVFVGESHDDRQHHELQANVIRELARQGRRVTIGLEMLPSDVNTDSIASWTSLGIGELADRLHWKDSWGDTVEVYSPVLRAAQETNSRIVGLNVPRSVVRSLSRGGFEALEPKWRERVGWPDEATMKAATSEAKHRALFEALMGGHPISADMENMYAAQVYWDVAMARAAQESIPPETAEVKVDPRVTVVLSGVGHMLYGLGIPQRLTSGQKSLSVACIGSDAPEKVSRYLADFVFRSRAEPESRSQSSTAVQ